MRRSTLIALLIQRGVLKSPALIEAFETVDRADFVPSELREMAYEDVPLPIGAFQTISQPYTVAFMLELLHANLSDRVLDLGSGSGWTTALLASLSRHVDAVERIEELLAFARKNLEKYDFRNITLHQAKEELGLVGEHFDKILVSCAADELPQSLLDQLNPGGIMVIPVGNSILRVKKQSDGTLQIEEHPGFVFVPLIRDDI